MLYLLCKVENKWITLILKVNIFLEKLYPADIIGALVIIGGFILLFNNIDGVVGGAVIAVVTYYFVSSKNRDYKKDNKSE